MTTTRARRGATPTSISTYAIGTYPAFADNPACACHDTDPDLFFPDMRGGSTAQAKRICRTCPLVDRCRQWAIDQGDWLHGVWGATSHLDRKHIRRCRHERRQLGVCRHGTGCRRGRP